VMAGMPRNRNPLHHSRSFQLMRSAAARILVDWITTDAFAQFIKRRGRIHFACVLAHASTLRSAFVKRLSRGKKPHSDKHLTGLRPDRGGRKWLRVSLKNE